MASRDWRRAGTRRRRATQPVRQAPILVVTVDTESDDAWAKPDRIRLANLRQIARFQELCEYYGILPTYLVTYECAVREESVGVLKPLADGGRCEIGHHLHAWTAPPFAREAPSGIDARWTPAYQFELPDDLFFDKADCLHEAIRRSFGVAPTAHRAGRWGVDQRTIDWLTRRSYVVDTSVTPLTSWRNARGRSVVGPSFARAPRTPYVWASSYDRQRGVLEIPVTSCWRGGAAISSYARLIDARWPGANLARRALRRVLAPGFLRPNPHYPLGFFEHGMAQCIRQHAPVVNMMLHSSELAYGCSPSTATREDVERTWERLTLILRLARKHGMRGATLTAAARALRAAAPSGVSESTPAPLALPAKGEGNGACD